MSTYWLDARDAGLRQVAFAESQLPPGTIGAVFLSLTVDSPEDVAEASIMLADAGDFIGDRYRRYEEDFNALVALGVEIGTVTEDVGERAKANFHDAMRASQLRSPEARTRFY